MTTLVIGKNSSIGKSIGRSPLFRNLVIFDRKRLGETMSSKKNFRNFLEIENITNIIYLMVEREVDSTANYKKNEINYLYPLQIWDALQERPDISLIWVSSIFANDNLLVAKHPYLEAQNMAHKDIMESRTRTSAFYSRISFSQIYGSSDFVRHQPFLYSIKKAIGDSQDIQLLNGKRTKRNFINISDVCTVLADSKNWIMNPNVSCVSNQNTNWWEIAESFKQFYKSKSVITDFEDENKFDNRQYSTKGFEDISSNYSLKDLCSVIREGAFS